MPTSELYTVHQIPLREMERGLAQPVATVELEPNEISERLGITFEVVQDDLDQLQAALVEGAAGRQFALVRHQNQPHPGTDILTNERSSDLRADLSEAVSLFRFGNDELRWVHPDARGAAALPAQYRNRVIAGVKQWIHLEERRTVLHQELESILERIGSLKDALFGEDAKHRAQAPAAKNESKAGGRPHQNGGRRGGLGMASQNK
jgi:hypothetical protein